MTKIRFHLDESVSNAISEGLRLISVSSLGQSPRDHSKLSIQNSATPFNFVIPTPSVRLTRN